MRNGTLERRTDDAGQTSWTLSLIGTEQALGPVVDLTLDFNANAPDATFENLRFQGQLNPNYNGVTAEVDALGTGQLGVEGAFDAGQTHNWRVQIDPGAVDQTGGPSQTFAVDQPIAAGTYRVTVSNPNPASEPGPVFLEVTLSWP